MWFGHGTKPQDETLDSRKDALGSLDQRICMSGLAAIAGPPQPKRYHAAASFSGLALDRLVTVMRAWIGGLSLDQTSFAARFFNRPPDSPVVQHLHQAAVIVAGATTHTQMRDATDQLAAGMMAVQGHSVLP